MSYANRKEVAIECIEEGTGYFVTCYTSADEMPDEETKKAFIEAKRAINRFEELIELDEIEEE